MSAVVWLPGGSRADLTHAHRIEQTALGYTSGSLCGASWHPFNADEGERRRCKTCERIVEKERIR